MICSEKVISPEQWVDHVEGLAPDSERTRVQDHLARCEACRRTLESLSSARRQLMAAAAKPAVAPSTVERIWTNICFRIRRFQGDEQGGRTGVDLAQLRSILVSMCGEATAESALQREAPADPNFARNVGSIVEVMCGSRAARFVEHAAETARRQKVA